MSLSGSLRKSLLEGISWKMLNVVMNYERPVLISGREFKVTES